MADPAALAQGQQLAQLRPSVTTPVTLFSVDAAPQGLLTEVTLIKAPVITGTVIISLYHDDDGTTYDSDTLICRISRTANPVSPLDSVLFQAQSVGSGIFVKPGGSIGVQVDTADEVPFSLYGITETLAVERIRPR